MDYNVISTGSQGNAVVINNEVLIDCGVPFKALKLVFRKIKIVLLTHIHTDHFKRTTIKRLAFDRPTLRFGCCEWLVPEVVSCGVEKKNIDVFNIGEDYDYSVFKIRPIKLYHNVPNCGYKLFFGDRKVLYATDTNTLDGITAENYDLYMVEANYTNEEMAERIKQKQENGSYPYEYEVLQNHLSKENCDAWLNKNMGNNSIYVHLHGHTEKED